MKLKYNKRKVISASKFTQYNIDEDNSSDQDAGVFEKCFVGVRRDDKANV